MKLLKLCSNSGVRAVLADIFLLHSFCVLLILPKIFFNFFRFFFISPFFSNLLLLPSASFYSARPTPVAPEPPPSKPFFVTPLESDLHLSNGEALILKCKVTGYPHPKCTWYKDGTPLKKNGQSYEIGGRNGNMHLKIPEAFEDDGGVYSCLASNPSGQDSTSCNVSVSGSLSFLLPTKYLLGFRRFRSNVSGITCPVFVFPCMVLLQSFLPCCVLFRHCVDDQFGLK